MAAAWEAPGFTVGGTCRHLPNERGRPSARGVDIRFAYSAWRYFLQWTIEIRGRPLFQKLLLDFMDYPAEAEQVFRDVYGEDLSIAVCAFRRALGKRPLGSPTSRERDRGVA